MKAKLILKSIWSWAKHNSTKLLAAGAITAEALGFWFMHKEAPIVRDRLDALDEDAKWLDKVKAAGPVYLPAIGMFLLSTGCVIGGCAMGERKAAIMASLYSASEASIRRLEQKVVEELGPEKAQELHEKAKEEFAKEVPATPTNVKNTGRGDKLFFESLTGQWFLSEYNAVLTDEARFNAYLNETMWLDFNEWLDTIGAERAKWGNYFGFNADYRLKTVITSDHKSSDGQQFYIIDYVTSAGYGPVMYNGKQPLEFHRIEDCYPPEF